MFAYPRLLSVNNHALTDVVLRRNNKIKIHELKEEERPVRSLNDIQINKLLTVAEPSIKIRILLALGTGLRRGDIEALKASDLDFAKNCIITMSRKTGKGTGSRRRILKSVLVKRTDGHYNDSPRHQSQVQALQTSY
jgi:integrase